MLDEQEKDQRQHERYPLCFPVAYDGEGVMGQGQAADLSILGCAVVCDAPVPAKSYITLQLSLPDGETPLDIDLAVVRGLAPAAAAVPVPFPGRGLPIGRRAPLATSQGHPWQVNRRGVAGGTSVIQYFFPLTTSEGSWVSVRPRTSRYSVAPSGRMCQCRSRPI